MKNVIKHSLVKSWLERALCFVLLVGILALVSGRSGATKAPHLEKTKTPEEAVAAEKIFALQSDGFTLKECVDIALKNSREIKISLEKVDLAKIKKGIAYRDLYPALSLSWSTTKGERSHTGPDYKGGEYGAEMEQEIWPRDYIKYSYLQSKEGIKFSQFDSERSERDLAYEVAKAFYEAVAAKKDLKDQIDIVNKAKNLRDLAEKEMSSGLISKLEYLKVVSQHEDVMAQAEARGYVVEFTRTKLHNLVQLESDVLIDVDDEGLLDEGQKEFSAGTEDKRAPVMASLDEYIAKGLSDRPEMKLQNSKEDFYWYGKKSAAGKGMPKLSFVSSYKKIGNAFKPDEIDYDKEWLIGAKVSIPWFGNTLEYSFDKGRSVPNRTSTYSTANSSMVKNQSTKLSVLNGLQYYYDNKEASIAYESAIKEKEDQARKIILEITEAFYSHKSALTKTRAAFRKVLSSLKEEEVTDVKRQYGEESLLMSSEALASLLQAKMQYNRTLSEYYVSAMELNKAIGKEPPY